MTEEREHLLKRLNRRTRRVLKENIELLKEGFESVSNKGTSTGEAVETDFRSVVT